MRRHTNQLLQNLLPLHVAKFFLHCDRQAVRGTKQLSFYTLKKFRIYSEIFWKIGIGILQGLIKSYFRYIQKHYGILTKDYRNYQQKIFRIFWIIFQMFSIPFLLTYCNSAKCGDIQKKLYDCFTSSIFCRLLSFNRYTRSTVDQLESIEKYVHCTVLHSTACT